MNAGAGQNGSLLRAAAKYLTISIDYYPPSRIA
jgi:hypothetical protein